MGYRNTTSTALNFGEEGGAIGYLVGEANKGLAYMFQMMNEARIGVGLGAACLGYQSYIHALAYAKDRPQGRLPGDKDPLSPQVNIIEHADVRRMLLQQKAYAEGSFSLCLFASSLFEDSRTGTTEQQRCDADELLDLLTPVVKTYSSRYGVIASDIGIQVLGGAGYTREYPLEQLYRDNRLNPIHEGTEGIQGIDLLSRKLGPKGGKGYELFVQAIKRCLEEANAKPGCEAMSTSLSAALNVLDEVTRALQQQVNNDPIAGLSNATPYLDLFGRVVVGWIWLRQALVATNAITQGAHGSDISFYAGKLHTAQYFMQWELADLPGLAALLVGSDRIVHDMQKDWF
jgi:butyryl-CoA dehydrogenase